MPVFFRRSRRLMASRNLMAVVCFLSVASVIAISSGFAEDGVGELPKQARLVLSENWEGGRIDADRWYLLRKKWGEGNHGVVPENVRVEVDTVRGKRQNVLVCEAHGDQYDGPVRGYQGQRTRVGGVIVSKPFFASGRFEVILKIGSKSATPEEPEDPTRPIGAVPAVWTYGYRWVQGDPEQAEQFQREQPLYNPLMRAYGTAANEYWSELDFPEYGKDGDYTRALYNTFCQNRHDPNLFPAEIAADGRYHTFTTEWRTELRPLAGVDDEQVIEHDGYWWVQDRAVAFDDYLGNPLKRLGPNRYAVYWGKRATHWIDGQRVGENTKYVPAMAAQLNLGIWLPAWAGPAPWKTSRVSFASIKVWQYDDPGDVRGVLTDDISDNIPAPAAIDP